MWQLLRVLAIVLLAVACGYKVVPTSNVPLPPVTTVTPPPPNLPAVDTNPLAPAPGQTVVTITFDDGRGSNIRDAHIMDTNGLHGTFFINSSFINTPMDFMTRDDLNWLATHGDEIAGHTLDHPHLTQLDPKKAKIEICGDRANLMDWGFPVRNFAYPFGEHNPEVEQIVADCGYNSARSFSNAEQTADDIPPANPYSIVSPVQATPQWTLENLQSAVQGVLPGGGWLVFVFHGTCPETCSDITVSEDLFSQFAHWLGEEQRQGLLIIRTVGEVMGGPVQPAPESATYSQ